jgi:hypothetical protein
MANKPEEFPIFTPLDSAAMQRVMDKIPQYLQNIAAVLEIKSPNEIFVNPEALYEMLTS